MIDVSVKGIDEILDKLSRFERKEQNKIIKASVNDTLKYLKKQAAKQAAAMYVKRQNEISATLTQKKATVSNKTATLISKGPMLEPLDYKASPTTMEQQQHRKVAAKLKVKRGKGMKALVIRDRKAFLAPLPWARIDEHRRVVETGDHLAIVQRTGKKRYPIKKLLSSSVPGLLGSDSIKQALSEATRQRLAENLNKHIEEVLSK